MKKGEGPDSVGEIGTTDADRGGGGCIRREENEIETRFQ